MQDYDYSYHCLEPGGEPWLGVIVGSLLAHILIIVGVVFFPQFSVPMDRMSDRQVVEVDLSAIDARTPTPPAPDSGRAPETEEAAPDDFAPKAQKPLEKQPETPEAPSVPVKKAPEKHFDPSDYIVEKPRPKVKQSMKQKTIRTEAVHRSAVEKVREKSGASRPPSVADRIKALESEVAGQTRTLSEQKAGKPRAGGRHAVKDMSQIEVYQAEVAVALKNNWVFSEKLAGQTQGLESRLVIKIMPDGAITDVWYAKRSGNNYLDQSAYRTVMKSDPLPPLPEGYPYYHLMLGFTPSGLRR